jgi:hypothetical protein
MVGVGVWLAGLVAQRVYFNAAATRSAKIAVSAALVLGVVLAVLVATQTDALDFALFMYRQTALFDAASRNEFWFYHLRFLLFYPTLWSLAGVLAVVAAVHSPRLAWFAVSVFSIGFLLMSFAGPKATRYLSFAPPFLMVIWGIALGSLLPVLWRYTEATRARLMSTFALPPSLSSIAVKSVVVTALLVAVLMNPFWLRTATIIGNVALPSETPVTDWRAARDALAPWTADADIMITTEELGALYFLGRSDVRFSPSKIVEIPLDQQFEFGIDHRTGLPLITKPESVERLIECFPRGIIVGPSEHWGNPILISDAVAAVITKHATPIDVPRQSHLYAWGWTRDAGAPRPADCADLDRFAGRGRIAEARGRRP